MELVLTREPDAAVKMAATIASNSPIAVVSTKHLMNRKCEPKT